MDREATCRFPPSQLVTAKDLRLLQTRHEGMTGALGTALSDLLRSPVEASLAGVERFSYGKFVQGLVCPSYFNVLKAEPLTDCLMLDVELAILYPLLDRMLGGGHEDEPPPRRALSDVELPLAARIARLFLDHLRQAWQDVLPLRLDVLQVESHPQRLRALPSEEAVAIVNFRLTIGEQHGTMRLCVPCRAIRQISDKLAGSPGEDGDASLAEVVATLATSSMAVGDLRGLRVGDIIATETDADSAATVSVDGQPKFRAKPGVHDGRKAVVLSEQICDSTS
jgi:flagellar motor switch protein FliM